jgi:transcriptional regulator with XRE-family HTH domain
MARAFSVDAAAVRALRFARGLTQEQLADRSGFTDKTIRALEGARRQSVRAQTVECIAKALGAPVASFATPITTLANADRGSGSTTPARANASTPAPSPTRPRLNDLVAAERALGVTVEADGDGRRPITAKSFQDVVTAFLAHADDGYSLIGVVDEQRGVGFDEADALDGICGESARFSVRMVLATGDLLRVTVHTRAPSTTLAMQACVGDAAALDVRVLAKRADDDAASRRFAWFESPTLHPWTFLVERVRAQPAERLGPHAPAPATTAKPRR